MSRDKVAADAGGEARLFGAVDQDVGDGMEFSWAASDGHAETGPGDHGDIVALIAGGSYGLTRDAEALSQPGKRAALCTAWRRKLTKESMRARDVETIGEMELEAGYARADFMLIGDKKQLGGRLLQEERR